MYNDIASKLRELSEEDLLSLLDMVSEEVKRRNDMAGMNVPAIDDPDPRKAVLSFIESLSAIGIKFRTADGKVVEPEDFEKS